MRRDLTEVLASQKIMLQRNGKSAQGDDADFRRMFDKHLGEITVWLAQQDNMEVLYMNYNEVLAQPRASAKAISHFLGNRLDVFRSGSHGRPHVIQKQGLLGQRRARKWS